MILPIFLLLAILSFSCITTATQSFNVECTRYLGGVSRGNHTFQPPAVHALASSLSTNAFTPALPPTIKLLPGRTWSAGLPGAGGYQICVKNLWPFRSVTFQLADLADAVQSIADRCCGPDAVGPRGPAGPAPPGTPEEGCLDGRTVVVGSNGDELKVVGQSLEERCCGMWACI